MKNKPLKRFYEFIWIVIFIISIFLLIENIWFIHKETIKSKDTYDDEICLSEETYSSKEVKIPKEDKDIFPTKSQNIDLAKNIDKDLNKDLDKIKVSPMYSGIPILNYLADNVSGLSPNIFIDSLAKNFPINQYVVDAALLNHDAFVTDENSGKDLYEITNNIRNDNRIHTGKVESIENQASLPIDVIEGGVEELELEGEESPKNIPNQEVVGRMQGETFTLEQLENRSFFYNNFYIIDPSTKITDLLFEPRTLLEKNLSIEKDPSKPQILIYHTHSQEEFCDSRPGVEEDTVVGVGSVLAQVLSDYGYNVIHDKSKYDIMGEGLNRSLAYNYANAGITKILEENPSIEILIDVHRDSGNKRVATINGVDIAQVMLFNGIVTDAKGQPIEKLPNPNLQGNLAFSLQLQLKSREFYPGFMYKNYLKSLRYNLHHKERSILAEVGTVNNTVEEAKNSMHLLGSVIDEVLSDE